MLKASDLEAASIVSITPGTPRFDPGYSPDQLHDDDNLMLLCPAHHNEIDDFSKAYTVEALREIRQLHLAWVEERLAGGFSAPPQPAASSKLESAITTWQHNRRGQSEEFWQKFFEDKPELLSIMVRCDAFTLKSRCYLGGKDLDNSGGSIADFVALHESNCSIIEIKTPEMELVSGKYREHSYAMSSQLVGAISQVLNYRATIMADVYALQSKTRGLSVHNPPAFILAGDLEVEQPNADGRRSFELFRRSLNDVTIVTYDELFRRLGQLASLYSPDS